MGIFGVIFLAILAIVSNTSEEGIQNVENQMFLMNCPLPVYNGEASVNTIEGYVVNYTVTQSSAIQGDFNGTRFDCFINLGLPAVNAIPIQYGASTFWGTIPYGWLTYIADTIGKSFTKIGALFGLIGLFVSPTSFNILGYDINDIGGIALMFVVSIYALCYVAIGTMMYKIISPFSGVG